MDAETSRLVGARANEHCEYCGIHQRIYPDFAFHIEHVVARQHGGGDDLDNLASSCHLCNSKNGPNLSGLDPETGTRRFHLRKDRTHAARRVISLGELRDSHRIRNEILRREKSDRFMAGRR